MYIIFLLLFFNNKISNLLISISTGVTKLIKLIAKCMNNARADCVKMNVKHCATFGLF